jgi:hypothetical protein
MSTSFTNLQAIPIDGALPTQNTSTVGKALISNGTNAGWNTVLSMIGNGAGQSTGNAVAAAILPAQTGQAGKILSTDGAGNLSWQVDAGAIAGVSSIIISGTPYTGAVTITNVPSATVAAGVSGTVGIGNGGTGATSAGAALTALGAAAAVHTHPAYATISSPVLAGNPTAPTPATNDNTTSIATTAFVQAQLAASVPAAVASALSGTDAVGSYRLIKTTGSYAYGITVPGVSTGTWVSRGQAYINDTAPVMPSPGYATLVQRIA